MPLELPSPALTRIHRELLDSLSVLDQLGAHVAAAHLASAIDALEDGLDSPHPALDRERSGDPIEAMARSLVSRFSDGATQAARRQLDGASGQLLLTWAAVVSRVDQMLAKQSIGPR